MDYKIATYVLGALLILSLGWHYPVLRLFGGAAPMQGGAGMMQGGMHMMGNGSMMRDGEMMGMQGMMMDMTARLKGKSGAELEKTFLEDMIVHHQGAVDMSKELLKGTTRPELVQFANDIITAQSREIEMQKQWLTEWFGENR